MRAAVYARVSTTNGQSTENQLIGSTGLRAYVAARGWQAVDYIDEGVSGAKDRRPGLDRLVADARRRRFDVLVVWSLDRIGRNLRRLVLLLDEFSALGIQFVSLREGLDTSNAAGPLQLHILAALAEFERSRCVERIHAGLSRARQNGVRLGTPKSAVPVGRVLAVAGLPAQQAAGVLGVSVSTLKRWRREVQQSPLEPDAVSPRLSNDPDARLDLDLRS